MTKEETIAYAENCRRDGRIEEATRVYASIGDTPGLLRAMDLSLSTENPRLKLELVQRARKSEGLSWQQRAHIEGCALLLSEEFLDSIREL